MDQERGFCDVAVSTSGRQVIYSYVLSESDEQVYSTRPCLIDKPNLTSVHVGISPVTARPDMSPRDVTLPWAPLSQPDTLAGIHHFDWFIDINPCRTVLDVSDWSYVDNPCHFRAV
ncbi:hypothetical protein J6590_022769 [Homalodisca vitripennis]|nr:hypothetical protein J6590_022768 [Homalodisca vitripennis]KAG8327344.1 hypothetical protein J6590_022769 [Homalodisca vitripennis]